MSASTPLNLKILAAALEDAAAIRARTLLQPAGGPGDKLFPPTYATGDGELRYAVEDRRGEGGRTLQTVLLDSVQSQANRIEEALLAGWDAGTLHFPVITVDFSDEKGLKDLGRLTSLQVPHRIADALLRDSVSEKKVRFRDTEAGQAYTEATPRNATAVYRYCPTALVFGVWDSTGPRGGSGAKFQRALVSEIVGLDVAIGNKTASRLDPAGIQANVQVFHRKDDPSEWTIDPEEAQLDKAKKPVPFSRKGAEGKKKGNPSAINHSNVAPSVDKLAGGVTIDHAIQTTVLSLGALRRLYFPTTVAGKSLDGPARSKAEQAARTALAALALAGVAWHRRVGFDLRSRCVLIPEPGGPLTLEILPADGGEPQRCSLSATEAAQLLADAHEAAKSAGFGWEREPVKLRPAPKLADLIRKSREVAAESTETEE